MELILNEFPKSFGEVNGTPISNKDTILQEINKAVDQPTNPSIEYILVRPFIVIPLLGGYGINYNSYGHSAIRYTTPEGHDVVMNIEGKKDGIPMVAFYEATDYLYGTGKDKHGSQRGVYNRNMVGIRIENVSKENIKKMHVYFLKLREYDQMGLKKFNIVLGPMLNFLTRGIIGWLIGHDKHIKDEYDASYNFSNYDLQLIKEIEYGNCAKWISEGLKCAGLITVTKVWPKSILVDIFENYKGSQLNIVSYQQPKKCQLAYGFKGITLGESVAPLQPFRDFAYSDLTGYSNCIVEVPSNTIKAKIIINPNPIKPNAFRNIVNNNWFVAFSAITTLVVLRHSAKFASYYLKFRTYSKENFTKAREYVRKSKKY